MTAMPQPLLCERCHTKDATVHISLIVHPRQDCVEQHFCPECGDAVQTERPFLHPRGEPLAPASLRPVLSLSEAIKAKLRAINDKLSELDPILQAFCARRGFTACMRHDMWRQFASEVWPSRLAYARGEIDRFLQLGMDESIREVLKRGFYPEMPWSLHAMASLQYKADQPLRFLTVEVFRGLPFSKLAGVLDERLEEAFSMMSAWTPEDVRTRGEIPNPKSTVFRSLLR